MLGSPPHPLFPYIKIEGFGDFHPPFGDDVIYERSQSTESNQRYQYAARATLCIVNVMQNSGAAQVVDEEGVGEI